MRAIVQVLLNAAALWLAATLVPGIHYTGGLLYLLLAGLIFGLVNLIVKPIVTFLSLPLIILTLGLFFLVINGLMLLLASALLSGFRVDGFLPALVGGIVIALFNWMVRAFASEKAA